MRTSGIGLVAGVAFASSALAQTVIYETGFENPPFTSGAALAGTDGWISQAAPATATFAIAQSSTFSAGAQGAETQGTQTTGSSWAWKDVAFNPVTAGTPFVTVQWDMNVSTTGTITVVGIDCYSATPFGRLIGVAVNATGVVQYIVGTSTAFVTTTTTVTRGQWYTFKIVYDFSSSTADIFVGSTQVASNVTFPAGTDFGDADLWEGGAGTVHAYYDNFKITADDSLGCYPDCNQSGTLTIADFGCFQAAFAAGNPYADCNQSGTLTIADFGCFQAAFAAGCP